MSKTVEDSTAAFELVTSAKRESRVALLSVSMSQSPLRMRLNAVLNCENSDGWEGFGTRYRGVETRLRRAG